MNEKKQLIEEIEQAPELLIKEVLNFLLFTKNRVQEIDQSQNANWETQLEEMAQDREIQAEIRDIERDFSTTEMDGLT